MSILGNLSYVFKRPDMEKTEDAIQLIKAAFQRPTFLEGLMKSSQSGDMLFYIDP